MQKLEAPQLSNPPYLKDEYQLRLWMRSLSLTSSPHPRKDPQMPRNPLQLPSSLDSLGHRLLHHKLRLLILAVPQSPQHLPWCPRKVHLPLLPRRLKKNPRPCGVLHSVGSVERLPQKNHLNPKRPRRAGGQRTHL